MTRQFFVILALLVGSNLAAPAFGVPHQTDVAGVYLCEGIGPEGKPYRGVVEIAREADIYYVRWTLSPEDAYVGLGILNGDRFAVSYFAPLPGVVLYKIEKGSRLVGEWTSVGSDGKVYPETLTKSDPDELKKLAPETKKPRRPIVWFPTVALGLIPATR